MIRSVSRRGISRHCSGAGIDPELRRIFGRMSGDEVRMMREIGFAVPRGCRESNSADAAPAREGGRDGDPTGGIDRL